MRLLKSHPILGLVNSYTVDSPQPANISYMWNFGSLLGACLIIQIITGVTLAMHYTPSVDLAFVSVEHIMQHFCVIPILLARIKKGVFNPATRLLPVTMEEKHSFFQWFSGFVDGEGSFAISCSSQGIWRWLFRIRVHLDDLPTLQYIQAVLGVGRINIDGSSCVYVVDSWDSIVSVIIPLFKKYSLITIKRLDFDDWVIAAQLSMQANTRKLTGIHFDTVLGLQSGMNSTRILACNGTSYIPSINAQWLLGFIEAEGTFGLKYLNPYFQIAQHVRSVEVLNAISVYLATLSMPSTSPIDLSPITMSTVVNKKTNVQTNTITGIDSLYFLLLPFLLSMQFVTRKSTDFYLWAFVVILHKLGQVTTAAGRSIVYSIGGYMNSNRYTTNPAGIPPLPDFGLLWTLLTGPFPIDPNSTLSHAELTRQLTVAAGSRVGYSVYLYENGNLVSGSPFASYGDVNEYLGLPRKNRVVSRYIDHPTKLYRGKYSFRSTIS